MRIFKDLSYPEKKDIYRYIVLNWNKKNTMSIADELEIESKAVHGIVSFLRKSGIPLIKKQGTLSLDENLKEELVKLYRQ